MKAKVYIAPTKYAYRAAKDGQSIQFLDTTMNLGWKHSDYMTDKVLKAARPAQEVLDEEAARRDWQPWEEPEEAPTSQSNAVQLAKDVLDAVRRFKGELTADGCRQAVGKSYFSHSGLDTGGYQCSPRGVKLAPKGEDFMDLTWAKFIKFCREHGLLEEESIKCNTKFAQKPAAAPPQAKTSTTSENTAAESSNPKPSPSISTAIMSGPASPAGAGAAAQSLSAVASASSEVQPLDSSAFDYTGLDQPTVDTLHLAERIIRTARQKYIVDLAGAVDMAHEELVRNSDGHNQHSEDTFIAWCRSVGISKTTAYQLLQVQTLISGSTPEEQAVLEAASPSLLYAAAKPSAPAELVQAVKDGDITTHKEYQALLAQLKAKDQELAAERADREAERASTSALLADEQQRRQESLRARLEAEKAAREIKSELAWVKRKEAFARRRAEEAEKITKEAQKNAMFQIQQAQDAENQRAMMAERERFHLSKIAELEARPVEVVGADPDEIERRAQVLADQKTAQIQAELAKIRTEQKASDNQSVQRAAHDAVILATRSMDAAWQAMAPMLSRLAPEEKVPVIYKVVNQLMCMKEEALQMIEKEKKPDADHQN